MDQKEILSHLPYTKPFLFVDGLRHVDDEGVKGHFTFSKELDFYKGHFKGKPTTPGVILIECCAQIGLVCLGIYLLGSQNQAISDFQIGMSSSEMEFLVPVYPNEKVVVSSRKVYFRFHKLKCRVQMHNSKGELVCRGTISGMLNTKIHG